MNDKTLDFLMHRMSSRRNRRDFRDYEDSRDSRDYEDSSVRRDSRRGDGRGNVDFEGTMEYGGRRDYARVRRDYEDLRDMRDYAKSPKLSKTDVHHWKQMMENEDGTRGPHYDMQQIMSVAEKHNIEFDDFDEKEFCIAVNMMYSDYCKVAHKYVAPDKELAFFIDMAKAFLDDEDGPGASEKIALYYHCIVDA